MRIGRGPGAGALHVFIERNHPERDSGGDARMLDAGQRGESFFQFSVKFLRVLLVVAAEAGVGFEEQSCSPFASRFDPRRLARAAQENRRRGQERERKGDLRDDQRIARQKFPASPNDIFVSIFLQVADDRGARKFHRRPEREADRAEHAKSQRRSDHGRVRAARPDEVERKQIARARR